MDNKQSVKPFVNIDNYCSNHVVPVYRQTHFSQHRRSKAKSKTKHDVLNAKQQYWASKHFSSFS